MVKKILVCGDRHWTDSKAILSVLKYFVKRFSEDSLEVIEGEAWGADSIAAYHASKLGLKVHPFLAQWEKYGRAAGHIRNSEMLNQKPDIVIGFHDRIQDSKGTHDMLNKSKKSGVPTYLFSRINGKVVSREW